MTVTEARRLGYSVHYENMDGHYAWQVARSWLFYVDGSKPTRLEFPTRRDALAFVKAESNRIGPWLDRANASLAEKIARAH